MEEGKVRVKVRAACASCRAKKAKCDAGLPRCSYCALKDQECVYPAEPIKRGPKKGAKYRKRGQDDSPTPPLRPSPPALCAVASASGPPPSKRPKPTPWPSAAPVLSPSNHPEASSSFTSHASRIPPIPSPDHLRHQLPPPPADYLLAPQLPSAPIVLFPHLDRLPSEISLHLIDIFFTHVNFTAFPLLHQTTFMRKLARCEIDPALLYAIAASAAPFSVHPSVVQAAPQLHSRYLSPPPTPAETWALAARSALHLAPKGVFALQSLQALAVLCVFELARGKGEAAWMDVGKAMRAAQLMGYDVERAGPEDEDSEMRRRIVWTLSSLETVLGCGAKSSAIFGSTSNSSYDSLLLPTVGRLERSMMGDWRAGGTNGRAGKEEVPAVFLGRGQVSQSLHLCGVEPLFVRAFDIFARTNRYGEARRLATKAPSPVNATPPDWDPASPFAKLSLDLSAWAMDLPPAFFFTPSVIASLPPSQLPCFYGMHVLQHLAQISLHRPYVPDFRFEGRRRSPARPVDGKAVFADSAHSKSAIHAIFLARMLVSATKSSTFALSPLAGYAAFTAATALLFDMDVQGSTAASQALQFFLRYLLTAADFYVALKPFHSTLVQLIQLHQTTFSHPSTHPSSTATAPLPHFFDRYEAFGVEEPALAPLFATPSPTPQAKLARNAPVQREEPASQGDLSGGKSPAEYLSMLKSILDERERIEGDGEVEDDEEMPTPIETFDARGLHHTQAEAYSPSNSQLFGEGLARDTYLPTTSSAHRPSEMMRTSSLRPPAFRDPYASSTSFTSYPYIGASPGQSNAAGLAGMTDPADMRTWLFSMPMAEGDVWEDESLTSFLSGCDWPMITGDQLGGS